MRTGHAEPPFVYRRHVFGPWIKYGNFVAFMGQPPRNVAADGACADHQNALGHDSFIAPGSIDTPSPGRTLPVEITVPITPRRPTQAFSTPLSM